MDRYTRNSNPNTAFDAHRTAHLPTPCVVIDYRAALRNCQRMQAMADDCGCALRPHVKTHRMPLFARMQLACGAGGITCAKVSEAEVMAEGGARDIFIAYPMIGEFRLERAARLLPRVDRLILAVDSAEGAERMSAFADRHGIAFEVRMEIDTGLKRTGVPREEAVALARRFMALPGLRLTGIYTFRGLMAQDGALDPEASGLREGEILREIRDDLHAAGIDIAEVSGGSTPTAAGVARSGFVTEVRPGTYIFGDDMLVREGVMCAEDIAARVLATVVSTPRRDLAVIDGGSKMFSADVPLGQPPLHFTGYAGIVGREDLRLSRLNEEHGMVTGTQGGTGLRVGQRLEMIPAHICTVINLQNEVYVDYGDRIERQRVEARGMGV